MSQAYDPPHQPELGSLTQSVRKKGLGTARGWLIFVGIVTILWYGYQIVMFDSMFDDLVRKEQEKAQRQGMMIQVNPEMKEEARKLVNLIAGGTIALGVVFIVLGLMVYKFPVVCTVLGLILYLGGQAVFVYMEPESLARGLIMKIIIIAALVKAIQAALAYEKEERAQRAMSGYSV